MAAGAVESDPGFADVAQALTRILLEAARECRRLIPGGTLAGSVAMSGSRHDHGGDQFGRALAVEDPTRR